MSLEKATPPYTKKIKQIEGACKTKSQNWCMKGGPQKQILRELSITFVATIPVYRPIEQVYNLRVCFRLTGLASSEKRSDMRKGGNRNTFHTDEITERHCCWKQQFWTGWSCLRLVRQGEIGCSGVQASCFRARAIVSQSVTDIFECNYVKVNAIVSKRQSLTRLKILLKERLPWSCQNAKCISNSREFFLLVNGF